MNIPSGAEESIYFRKYSYSSEMIITPKKYLMKMSVVGCQANYSSFNFYGWKGKEREKHT